MVGEFGFHTVSCARYSRSGIEPQTTHSRTRNCYHLFPSSSSRCVVSLYCHCRNRSSTRCRCNSATPLPSTMARTAGGGTTIGSGGGTNPTSSGATNPQKPGGGCCCTVGSETFRLSVDRSIRAGLVSFFAGCLVFWLQPIMKTGSLMVVFAVVASGEHHSVLPCLDPLMGSFLDRHRALSMFVPRAAQYH